MEVCDLSLRNTQWVEQAASLLYVSFRQFSPEAWPTMEAALDEVRISLDPGKISRVMVHDGDVLGWVGGIPQYDGNVWELHPLVVREDLRGRGLGRRLIFDLEQEVRKRGGLTIWLGTDDEAEMTSLSGKNLFADPWGEIRQIRNLKNHPYEFYQKVGFTIVGVMPDANGPGRPDIYMAKSVRRNG